MLNNIPAIFEWSFVQSVMGLRALPNPVFANEVVIQSIPVAFL
jgi:hypothetical protein